jgi:adenylate kinase family enzyme
MPIPKLIVLRGPSGSGKSTIAKALFKDAKRRTVLIDQDHYRYIFKPAGGGNKPNSDAIHKMIKANTLIALSDGYDVILEGILSVKSYANVLDDIFEQHPQENYMFYFDVSFEETVRRHDIRKTDEHRFGEAEMRAWYPAAHRSNHKLEKIIPEEFTFNETLDFVKKISRF